VISGSELVEIDTLLARFQKNIFGGHFFFENAVLYISGSYRPIFFIFNSKQRKTILYLVLNFEENRSKIATVRVPEWKSTKWPPWRNPFCIFKYREKSQWQISARSSVKSFIKICLSVWAVEITHTDRQTDRHTHTHTHTHTQTHIHTDTHT